MAFNHSAVTYAQTSGASLTVMTTAGYFVGALLYASGAAATLTIVDSGGGTILSWSGAAAAVLNWSPVYPIAMVNGLTVTNSGAGTYTIVYAKRV